MRMNRREMLAGVAAGASLAAAGSAWAADLEKIVKLVVAFPAGGGQDLVARLLALHLTKDSGQTVIVENNSGGAGFVGIMNVVNKRPDGSTLLMNTMGLAINAAAYKKVPFDPIADIAPVAMIGTTPYFIGINPKLPFTTLAEFFKAAKEKPGEYKGASFATAPGLLSIEMLKQRAGIDVQIIPYRGVAPAAQAVSTGESDFLMVDGASLLPFIDSGQLRGVAVTARERVPERPDLPTVIESGAPDFVIDSWFGIFARGGTPAPLLDYWNQEINKVLQIAEVKERLTSIGLKPVAMSRSAFEKVYVDEIAKWKAVVEKGRLPLLD
jgi:tripartite-type tricarboxylate transporter receptor subunit TctC